MINVKTLKAKAPSEELYLQFDYSENLTGNESIVESIISISVINGIDSNASAMIASSPINAAPLVTQKVVGGISKNQYLIECLATTSDGEKILTSALLPVINNFG